MSKVMCFPRHKIEHFGSQCPNKKKGKSKTATMTTAQMEDMAENFDKNFTLVSFLFGTCYPPICG